MKTFSMMSSMLTPLMVYFMISCDTINQSKDFPVISLTLDQRDPNTKDVVVELGNFELDMSNTFDLNDGARLDISVDSVSSISFYTDGPYGGAEDESILILFKNPSRWYKAFFANSTVGMNPDRFEGEIYAFFIENIFSSPSDKVMLYITANDFIDSLQLDPSKHSVPPNNITIINSSMIPALQDSNWLYYFAETEEILEDQYIPILVHSYHKSDYGYHGLWTMELFDKTTDYLGVLPGHGYNDDYKAFIITFSK